MTSRPPRNRAVRLIGKGPKPKAPLDAGYPALVLSDRLYNTTRRWWGCRTGSGLWVLDFDAKEGHLEVLQAWEAEHGPIPGWHVRSGSGGRHVWLHGPHDLKHGHRIAVEGYEKGVELHAHPSSQVVWHSAPGYEALGPKPFPLLNAPDWLVALAGQPPPLSVQAARGEGGARLTAGEPTPEEYVYALLGEHPNAEGNVRCPHHGDVKPSLHVYSDHVWCFVCGYGTRERGLAALVLGTGRVIGTEVYIEPADRAAAVEFARKALGRGC